MTTTQSAQYGVPVDTACDVSHIGPVPGSLNIRVWVRPRGSADLILQFDLPSGTLVGRTGRLQGRRHGQPVGILEEVARNCGVDASAYKHDFVYEDSLVWTPDTFQAAAPPSSGFRKRTYDPGNLPVSISIAVHSVWSFRGRQIEVISSTGGGLDAILQVKVVHAGPGRRGVAKKVSVRTLLSRYNPV